MVRVHFGWCGGHEIFFMRNVSLNTECLVFVRFNIPWRVSYY